VALPPLPDNVVSTINRPKKKPYTLSDIELFVPPKANDTTSKGYHPFTDKLIIT
jgi:hypothetical protein